MLPEYRNSSRRGHTSAAVSRWVLAKTGVAHFDHGERSSESLRVKADHVVVTLCRAHLDAAAKEVPTTYPRRCSNCVHALLSGMSAFPA
jgi:hypothetical protein